MSDKSKYEIGYGKPPKHSQFAPGHSGNPKGRPKGTRNLKTDLDEELSQKVTITENGKRRSLSKQKIIVKTMVTKAVKGEQRSIDKAVDLIIKLFGVEEETRNSEGSNGVDDQAIIDAFVERRVNGEVDSG